MSFRARLILAFGLLALSQAGLFTLLSDQLLRDGLEGEADERLALVGSLWARELPPRLWPAPAAPGPDWKRQMHAELMDYARAYGLERASLLFEEAFSLDSAGEAVAPDLYWAADGLKPPRVKGQARVSGPLFRSEQGWHKTLYLKLDPARDIWLRVEAGTPFLGQVSTLQRRLYRLALALMLPSLLLGALLAVALSRRVRSLSAQLQAASAGVGARVSLPGSDEFAQLAGQVDGLLQSLAREREEKERLAAARLAQARSLAFGVAHELRNPLAGLTLQVGLLRRRSAEGAPPEELAALAERALGEASRLEATVARFLEFARTPELVIEPVDLGRIAREAAAGRNPVPRLEGQAKAQADARSCAVILGVLLSNACEAAGEQGSVELRLSSERGRARLRVWDSGAPVPESERERLFTPFFSRKPKGLGLGLATAALLAEAMQGRLELESDGKTFMLELPEP